MRETPTWSSPCIDGAEWRGRWRIATRPDRTSDEYAVWLLALLQHCGLKVAEIDRCVIGTVVPAALYNLRRLSREWFHVEPLIARAAVDGASISGWSGRRRSAPTAC